MLLVKESSLLFSFMSLCSRLCLSPFTVDQKRGKITQFSPKKHLIWAVLYAIVVLHYLSGLYPFLLLLTIRRDRIVLYHLPAQFDAIIIPFMIHPVIVATFQYKRDLLVKVFNALYEKDSVIDQERRPP